MSGRSWYKKEREVLLEDCRKWSDRIWREFGGLCQVTLTVTPTESKVKPAVRLTVTKLSADGNTKELYSAWEVVMFTQPNSLENAVIQLISQAYLVLREEVRASAQSVLFA